MKKYYYDCNLCALRVINIFIFSLACVIRKVLINFFRFLFQVSFGFFFCVFFLFHRRECWETFTLRTHGMIISFRVSWLPLSGCKLFSGEHLLRTSQFNFIIHAVWNYSKSSILFLYTLFAEVISAHLRLLNY